VVAGKNLTQGPFIPENMDADTKKAELLAGSAFFLKSNN